MFDNVEFYLNTNGLENNLVIYPLRIRKAIADGLDHASRSFLKTFYQERLQGPPGIHARHGGIFHRFRRITMENGKIKFLDTRGSQASTTAIIAKSSKDIYDLKITIYSQSKVAGILEKGGDIRSSKKMPIPLNEEAREMAREKGPLVNLKPIKINGKMFLGREDRRGKVKLLFILKNILHIKAKLGFYQTYSSHKRREHEIIDEAFVQGMAQI